MNHSGPNERGRCVGLSRSGIFVASLLCYIALSGFQCDDQDVSVPDPADVETPGYTVGVGFGSPQTNPYYSGTGDPCQRYTGGIYPIKKIVVSVFRLDGNGNEVAIYPDTVLRDGTHFSGGNPHTPKGPGVKFKVPLHGAYKMRIRIYGYPCDELPNPSQCLHCCSGDNSAIPFWEEVSEWKTADDDNMPYAYISHPEFKYCI